jgi:hypothetical protein
MESIHISYLSQKEIKSKTDKEQSTIVDIMLGDTINQQEFAELQDDMEKDLKRLNKFLDYVDKYKAGQTVSCSTP